MGGSPLIRLVSDQTQHQGPPTGVEGRFNNGADKCLNSQMEPHTRVHRRHSKRRLSGDRALGCSGCQLWCVPAVRAPVGHLSGSLFPHQVSPAGQRWWEGRQGQRRTSSAAGSHSRGRGRDLPTSALCHLHFSGRQGKVQGLRWFHLCPAALRLCSLRGLLAEGPLPPPGIFHQLQRWAAELPSRFGKHLCSFDRSTGGSGQKGGGAARPKPGSPALGPAASPVPSGPQCPHQHNEDHALDQGSFTQIPRRGGWNSAPQRLPRGHVSLGLPGLGVSHGRARSLDFYRQSPRSSIFVKRSPGQMKHDSGPGSAHRPALRTFSPSPPSSERRWSWASRTFAVKEPGDTPSPAPAAPVPPPASRCPLTSARGVAGSGPG